MPRHVRERRKGEGGARWKIVDPDGSIRGESNTRKDAEASARAANAALRRRRRS